ncbi:MAG: hypothetical protein CL927_05720 [Deltaproteobacteria bacterium]|nr:hypothetical protein [Deltaproteobacteria bacterium]HCH64332.1 hypothetical protein [Deltaproteobacteria bacterium]
MHYRHRDQAPPGGTRPLYLAACCSACLALVGCNTEFAATWKGECDVGVGSRGTELPVKITLGDDGRDALSGTGEFEYNEHVFEGAASGRIADEDALKVDIEGVAGGYLILLEIEAEMGPDDLEGICAFSDQDTLYEGDIVLSAVEPD